MSAKRSIMAAICWLCKVLLALADGVKAIFDPDSVKEILEIEK